jgi:hypothetical protein
VTNIGIKIIFLGRYLMKGDVDDDAVRTSALQIHATATLRIEEFFLRTQYLQLQLPSC